MDKLTSAYVAVLNTPQISSDNLTSYSEVTEHLCITMELTTDHRTFNEGDDLFDKLSSVTKGHIPSNMALMVDVDDICVYDTYDKKHEHIVDAVLNKLLNLTTHSDVVVDVDYKIGGMTISSKNNAKELTTFSTSHYLNEPKSNLVTQLDHYALESGEYKLTTQRNYNGLHSFFTHWINALCG